MPDKEKHKDPKGTQDPNNAPTEILRSAPSFKSSSTQNGSPMAIKSHPNLELGDVLEDRGDQFKIEAKLMNAGLGVYYKAQNLRTHRPVFIKQLLTQYYQNPGTNQNDCEMYWTREQKILQLQSASPVSTIHILGAISLITTQNPEYYFILDYLNAPTLEGWVSKQYSPEKPPHLRDYKIFLSSLFLPLVDHLNFIHQQGIIHRDLSAKNILVLQQENHLTPVIFDWSLAKDLPFDEIFNPKKPYISQDIANATRIRALGKPPEIVEGQEPIAASDLYMLGYLIYYFCSGGQKLHLPVVPADYILHLDQINPDIPLKLTQLVENLTQYEPADRIPTAEKVHEEMNDIVQLWDSMYDPQLKGQVNSRSAFVTHLNREVAQQGGKQTASSPNSFPFAIPKEPLPPPEKVKPSQKAAAISSPEVKPSSQAKPEAKPKQKPESKPAPAPKPEAKPKQKPESKPAPAPKPEAKPKQKPESKPAPAPKPEAKSKQKPESKPVPVPKPEAKSKQKPESKLVPAPKPEAKPKQKPESKLGPASKSEAKPKPKPEAKPAPTPKPWTKAKPKPEAKPAPAPKPEVKAKQKTEVKPEVKAKPKPETKPAPTLKPEVKTKPKPEAKPAPASKSEFKAKPKPEVKPAPSPKPEVKPAPSPKPEVKAKPKPAVKAKQKSETLSKNEEPSVNLKDIPNYLLDRMVPKSRKYFLKNILELEKMPRKDLEEAMEHLMGERMKYDNTYGLEKAIIEEIDFKTQRIQVRLQMLVDMESETLIQKLILEPITKGTFDKLTQKIGPNYNTTTCAQDILNKLGKIISKIPLSEMALRHRLTQYLEEHYNKANKSADT